MLDSFKRLVKDKEEILTEEVRTVKMFVPLSFELKNGKCENQADQELYEFLQEREEVITEEEDNTPQLDNIIINN